MLVGMKPAVDEHPGEPLPRVLRAALGTLLFSLLVPGTVVGLVPYWLTGYRLAPPLLGAAPIRWLGALLVLTGLPVFTGFLLRFVREGRGTPAPVAPTERLVVGGAFRFVRNPGYLAVLALVAGQGLWFGRGTVLAYAAALAVAFHLFVVLYEEPALTRRFGAEYESFRARVPRWLPRARRR
jgi:protein-S-isoprenylcysteine O-methyltransferase Ste14